MELAYKEFLRKKQHSTSNYGIEVNYLPDNLFDYQNYVAEHAIKKGRCAVFLDTGLGKTIIELTIAKNYIHHSNKPVLILCPLAVAFQFIKEAEKFGIDDIEYSKNGKFIKKIVIANYERLHYFNYADFDCVILDESSILKNFDGSIKNEITTFLKKVQYRFLFTATPSPNDFIELGTSSEALGYLGYTDMLTKFFTNNEDTISPMNIGTEWILKGHAKENFFRWVSGWSISMRKPSDLGFDDSKHILPELITNYHSVKNENNMIINGQILMFNLVARTNTEIHSERKLTIEKRCQKAVELAANYDTSVYWCNLNNEGDLLNKMDKNSYQIKGSMDLDEKEELLLGFINGDIKKLITKPKMTAFGLNWQHCGHTTYFPTFSWEQYYQAIRRFWRFGRKDKVIADLVFSDGQKRVMDSLIVKGNKSQELFSCLNSNLHQDFSIDIKEFDKQISLPKFLRAS
ncbi:MAG TPA: DEAD/DEAH box helicase [Chitinophagaceae bacterium]|nr:DEAD/DEAH box helicase [Chitinophagaceae bacterium]